MPEKIAIHVKRGIQKVLHINKALDRMYVEPQQLYCCDVGFTISKRFYKRKFFLMHWLRTSNLVLMIIQGCLGCRRGFQIGLVELVCLQTCVTVNISGCWNIQELPAHPHGKKWPANVKKFGLYAVTINIKWFYGNLDQSCTSTEVWKGEKFNESENPQFDNAWDFHTSFENYEEIKAAPASYADLLTISY